MVSTGNQLCADNIGILSFSVFTDRVSGKTNAIGRVRPSVCFLSGLWTNWPLIWIFGCVWS